MELGRGSGDIIIDTLMKSWLSAAANGPGMRVVLSDGIVSQPFALATPHLPNLREGGAWPG